MRGTLSQGMIGPHWTWGPTTEDPKPLEPAEGAPMALNGQTEARKLRDRLSHPVIDADGHWI